MCSSSPILNIFIQYAVELPRVSLPSSLVRRNELSQEITKLWRITAKVEMTDAQQEAYERLVKKRGKTLKKSATDSDKKKYVLFLFYVHGILLVNIFIEDVELSRPSASR